MVQTSKKIRSRQIITAVIGILLLLSFMPISAVAQSAAPESMRRTVRVAFPSQSGMSGVDESGDFVGYNYDYLQELSEYAGWNLEYITFEDMSANDGIMSAMQMVMEGEADLLGPLLKSDAVEEMFDFPEDNYGVVYTTLCALEKSDITSVNYSKLSPLRVAVYDSATTRNQEVSDYLDQLSVDYELIPCETSEEQLLLLQEGKADVISSITLNYFDGTRSVAKFAPRPYYFATTKGNTELLQELDAATQALNYTRPYLQQQLQEKYFGDTSSGYVLTDEELQRMEQMQTLNVLCASKQDAPYVLEAEDGEAMGMLVSLMNDFAQSNKIKITYSFCESPAMTENEWRTGQYDCMIGIPFSSEYCSKNNLVRSEAVISVDLVLFAKQTMQKPVAESTVAIYSRLAEQVNTNRFASILTFDDPMECYDAVERGDADYGCSDRLITEYNLYERDSTLVTVPLLGMQEDICIAVSREIGKEFISALNKYIHTLPGSTKTTYLAEGSRHIARSDMEVWFHDHPMEATAVVSVAMVLLVSTGMFAFYASRSRRKNRQLEKASAAKSEFLARMSHDIRTPMNAIIGYLAIAKDTEDCPEKVAHCIDNSNVAAKHLLQLINDVLDMSSIESGKIKIASEEFDLTHVVSDATMIFYQMSKAKKVDFVTRIIDLPNEWVIGDELRVNQIIMNLLSNAVKFTPEGGAVQLSVEQTAADENSSEVCFTVRDTGIGMSQECMERLFQPFEQESTDTARQYGGSGLGLSIVHSFVTMMGGTISVESKQSEGSTFCVKLRFAKAKKHPCATLTLPEGRDIRTLLVSANKLAAEPIEANMKALGLKADVVASGSYAVKRVHRRQESDYPYKLCVLDWNSLGEDAAATVAGIRAEASKSDLAVFAMGYDPAEFNDAALAAGASGCLKQPVFRCAWISLVEAVLAGETQPKFSSETVPNFDMTGKRILLAEDNLFNQEIAVTVLSKTGLQIDTADDGQQALALYTSAPTGTYDFILMDIQMPVMDGYQASKAIRESGRDDAETIPIVAMTANAFAEDVANAYANGMNAHIAKPVNYDKLFSVLYELGVQ